MSAEGDDLSKESLEWISQRRRPGNWFLVEPSDVIPGDILGWDRTILHLFQIYLTPEIRRRMELGLLDEQFRLLAAQLIQPEGQSNIVRINSEVRAVSLVRLSRNVTKGEEISISDTDEIVDIDLEEPELDCGHFTLIWRGRGWLFSFDFRSGRARSSQMIASAREFLATSQFAATQGHSRASVDNLFSACELISKAHLILYQNRAAKSKRHASIAAAINDWGRLGNIDRDFVDLFNRMGQLRSSARYEVGKKVALPSDEDFVALKKELEILEERVQSKVARSMARLPSDLPENLTDAAGSGSGGLMSGDPGSSAA